MAKERKSIVELGNYVQVVMKNGKTYPKLFKDPIKAISTLGIGNIKIMREIFKEQVTTKYTEIDSLTGTPENEL